MLEVFVGGIMILEIECIDMIAFGSIPSLILVNSEEIDANSHVSRARLSVQTQIHVSLVINLLNTKKESFLSIIQELSKRQTVPKKL